MSDVPQLIFPTVPLSNGLQIPIVGLGTSHHGGYSQDAIVYALTECGIRHIDTAKRYGCEEKLGKDIGQSGVARSDLWLTNKLWPADYTYTVAKKACLDSCSLMGVEYFDLFLMHWPGSFHSHCSNREMRAETWRALEELYKEGVCRAIGVSNFMVHHLEQLKEDCSIMPHVNQVEYHPFQQPNHLIEYCRQEGIVFEGYSPLAKGQALSNRTVLQIAEKHRRTPAQICIRWCIQVVPLSSLPLDWHMCFCEFLSTAIVLLFYFSQNGVVTIPKSTKKKRIQENCQVSEKSKFVGFSNAANCFKCSK
uniref:Zgc:110366 n=1 Tax=Echeneis naucrates TaxID=173247 RepID=A0A665TNX3_ECHNA